MTLTVNFWISDEHFDNKYGHLKWKYGQKLTFWRKKFFCGVGRVRSMEKIWPKNEKYWNIFWYYWFLCFSLNARQILSKSVKIWLWNNPFLKNAPSWDFNFCKFLSPKGHIWMGYYVFPSIIFFTLLTSEAHCE